MRDSILRGFGVLLGGLLGYEVVDLASTWTPAIAGGGFWPEAGGIVVGGVLGLLVAPAIGQGFVAAMGWVLRGLSAISLRDLLFSTLGLGAGLLLAFVVAYLLEDLPLIGPYVRPVLALVFGYLGLNVALQRRDEVAVIVPGPGARAASDGGALSATPKLLDTSAIIDGRIAEIGLCGFLEGPLLVPRSVLSELQRIADSADPLRRGRGRRGLDVLGRIQRELASVQILEDSPAGTDVDSQLVALARAKRAWIVTTDLNLGKIAELQGVRSLNVNLLAQALRPAVLPGEELSVHVVRDGKELGQGVGYLEDGTMVVVEGGRRHIGEVLDVVVSSVLQTSAGRMIFSRLPGGEGNGSVPFDRR